MPLSMGLGFGTIHYQANIYVLAHAQLQIRTGTSTGSLAHWHDTESRLSAQTGTMVCNAVHHTMGLEFSTIYWQTNQCTHTQAFLAHSQTLAVQNNSSPDN